jgi:oxygen-independent coproporphyrinogen-3 oxidase
MNRILPAGIYIHIPFCRSKCAYCSFVSGSWSLPIAERYVLAVEKEMRQLTENEGLGRPVDTIYLGGGTPSLLSAIQIGRLLSACRDCFEIKGGAEISLEANPGTMDPEFLNCCAALGINRVSLGAQSFSNEELASIGRIHASAQVAESCRMLRDCGLNHFNLDLILGLPGQSRISWMASLNAGVDLNPEHLSVYMLETDEKTPLGRAVEQGKCILPDEDSIAEWYDETVDFLESQGFPQYEISNFSRCGRECRHNLKYWRCEPVLAFGAAAHSFNSEERYANTSDVMAYISAVEEGRSPVEWRQSADANRILEETIFLGLRMTRGLDWADVRSRFRGSRLDEFEKAVCEMAAQGLLIRDGRFVRLTRRGILLSNEVFQQFVS